MTFWSLSLTCTQTLGKRGKQNSWLLAWLQSHPKRDYCHALLLPSSNCTGFNHVCTCVCSRMCVYAHICVCMLTYVRVCSHMCVYAHVCVCMLTCVRVCSHMCVYAHVCVCMLTYVCVCSRMCVYAHICVCANTEPGISSFLLFKQWANLKLVGVLYPRDYWIVIIVAT